MRAVLEWLPLRDEIKRLRETEPDVLEASARCKDTGWLFDRPLQLSNLP
jgi:hypothetical protein